MHKMKNNEAGMYILENTFQVKQEKRSIGDMRSTKIKRHCFTFHSFYFGFTILVIFNLFSNFLTD